MKISEQIKELVSNQYKISCAKWQEKQRQTQLAQAQIQQQQLRESLMLMSQKLASELVESFRGRDYPYLKPIISTKNLRFRKSYWIRQHWVFEFSMSKSTDIFLDKNDLFYLNKKMNDDIETTAQDLYLYLGADAFIELHNPLYNGISVWEVTDSGWEIIIKVATDTRNSN